MKVILFPPFSGNSSMLKLTLYFRLILLSITLSLIGCNNDNATQTSDNDTSTTSDTNKTQKAGHSGESGTLTTYTAPSLIDGRGKKLFAISAYVGIRR